MENRQNHKCGLINHICDLVLFVTNDLHGVLYRGGFSSVEREEDSP